MEVVHDHVGAHADESAEVLDSLQERGVGRRVLEVADVMAGHQLLTLDDGDRALELSSHRQHLAAGDMTEGHGLRRVAP